MNNIVKPDIGNNPFEKHSNTEGTGQCIQIMASINVDDLSTRAYNLLMYIVSRTGMIAGQDYVYIDRKKYMKDEDISSLVTVNNAIQELVKSKRIGKSCKQGWYWINPNMITIL